MSGLRPFRTIPKDLLEWERWMRAQNIPEAGDTITQVTNTITTATLWKIREFAGDRTLASDDNEYLMVSTSATAVNVTVPAGTFEIGAQITMLQYGAGTVTFVADTGVTINTPTGLDINEQHGTASLIQVYSNIWLIAGRIA